MERGSITKWLLFGLAIYLLMTVGKPLLFPTKGPMAQPYVSDETAAPVAGRAPEQICTIDGARFQAELSTYGGSLRHVYLKDYTRPSVMPADTLGSIVHLLAGDGKGSSEPADLVSTTKPSRSPLRVDLRAPDGDPAAQQVPYDDLDWKLAGQDGKSCTFAYEDAATSVEKVVSLGAGPFELAVDVTVKNLAPAARKHRFSIEQTAYRTKKEMEGHLGRQSELVTKAIAITATKSDFETVSDFEPSNFAKPEFTPEHWRLTPGEAKLAAVSSVYFTKLVIPEGEPTGTLAETFIEEVYDTGRYNAATKERDPAHGYVFRARLAYPEKELAPGATAHYRAVSFAGPKERDLLEHIGHGAPELLEFGVGFFSFATKDIARGLVWYLLKLHGIIGSWGWAIILLTITVRMVLFPLSLSQIKNSMAMRKLKPEMDVINEKYKDDAAQKGIAIQELWRKNGVSNPVVGCAADAPPDAGLVGALHRPADRRRALPRPLRPGDPGPVGARALPHHPHRARGLELPPAEAHARAGRPPAAEDDDVHDARHLHLHDALPPRGPRRVHGDEQRAGHRPAAPRRALPQGAPRRIARTEGPD